MLDHLTAICLAGFLTFDAADTVTSRLALNAGAREKNPAVQGWRFPILKGATAAAGTTFALTQGKAHPKIVRTILVLGAGFYAGLAVHNYDVYQTQRRINR